MPHCGWTLRRGKYRAEGEKGPVAFNRGTCLSEPQRRELCNKMGRGEASLSPLENMISEPEVWGLPILSLRGMMLDPAI